MTYLKGERRISPGALRPELMGNRFPPEVEQFGEAMCMHFNRRLRFWWFRKPCERFDHLERFILDIIVVRAKQRHFWGRAELETVVGHSAGTTSLRYARIRKMKQQAPNLWRAAHKLEGELAPKFIDQLIEEDTSEYAMEACEQIRTMRNL